MKIAAFGFVAGLCLALSACEETPQDKREKFEIHYEAVAQVAVKDRLRDPSSAQFNNEAVFIFSRKPVVCGDVNANNGFGGKSGSQRFIWRNGYAALDGEGGRRFFERLWKILCTSNSQVSDRQISELPVS
jgi:hypothetical protein